MAFVFELDDVLVFLFAVFLDVGRALDGSQLPGVAGAQGNVGGIGCRQAIGAVAVGARAEGRRCGRCVRRQSLPKRALQLPVGADHAGRTDAPEVVVHIALFAQHLLGGALVSCLVKQRSRLQAGEAPRGGVVGQFHIGQVALQQLILSFADAGGIGADGVALTDTDTRHADATRAGAHAARPHAARPDATRPDAPRTDTTPPATPAAAPTADATRTHAARDASAGSGSANTGRAARTGAAGT